MSNSIQQFLQTSTGRIVAAALVLVAVLVIFMSARANSPLALQLCNGLVSRVRYSIFNAAVADPLNGSLNQNGPTQFAELR